MTQEEMIWKYRRAARELEHKRAVHALDHPEMDDARRAADFAVSNKDDLDRLTDLAAVVDSERWRLDERVATAMEGINSVWQLARDGRIEVSSEANRP